MFDLHYFPFDYQQLRLIFRPKEHNKLVVLKSMPLKIFTTSVSPLIGGSVPEWTIHYPVERESQDNVSFNRPYSVYYVVLNVRRNTGYYMRQIVLVVFVLGLCGFATFSMPVDRQGDRVQVPLVLVLTCTAFQTVAYTSIPKVPYLTWFDKYNLFVLLFQIALIAQLTVVGLYFCTTKDECINDGVDFYESFDQLVFIDNALFYIYMSVFVLWHVKLVLDVRTMTNLADEKMHAIDCEWSGKKVLTRQHVRTSLSYDNGSLYEREVNMLLGQKAVKKPLLQKAAMRISAAMRIRLSSKVVVNGEKKSYRLCIILC